MKLFKLLLLLLFPVLCYSQSVKTIKINGELTIVHFNADWNSANDVSWFTKLSDAKKMNCNIAKDTKAGEKYQIVVVPTIIIFHEGEEVKRFQADISFTMKATKEEVQEEIDNIVSESF